MCLAVRIRRVCDDCERLVLGRDCLVICDELGQGRPVFGDRLDEDDRVLERECLMEILGHALRTVSREPLVQLDASLRGCTRVDLDPRDSCVLACLKLIETVDELLAPTSVLLVCRLKLVDALAEEDCQGITKLILGLLSMCVRACEKKQGTEQK